MDFRRQRLLRERACALPHCCPDPGRARRILGKNSGLVGREESSNFGPESPEVRSPQSFNKLGVKGFESLPHRQHRSFHSLVAGSAGFRRDAPHSARRDRARILSSSLPTSLVPLARCRLGRIQARRASLRSARSGTNPLLIPPNIARSARSLPALSTPVQNPTVPPGENPTDRRGDEPQIVAAS